MRSTCCNRGDKKQKRNQDQRLAERFDCWNTGEYGGALVRSCLHETIKKTDKNSIEEITFRAKTLCLQGQFGRAAKVLASECLAPKNKATFKALEKLQPKESLRGVSIPDDVASNAFQFSENVV